MLAMRRERGLGQGSLAWLESWCTDSSLAYVNGSTMVVMNLSQDALELPPGRVLLRSAPVFGERHESSPATYDGGHRLGSGETAWMNLVG
jgi:alpha-glucosidase